MKCVDDRVGDFTIQQRHRVGKHKCCRLANRLGQPQMVVGANDAVVLGQTPNLSQAFFAQQDEPNQVQLGPHLNRGFELAEISTVSCLSSPMITQHKYDLFIFFLLALKVLGDLRVIIFLSKRSSDSSEPEFTGSAIMLFYTYVVSKT